MARIAVTADHIGWADIIFTMEKRHAQELREMFPEATTGKRIIALHIADDYEFMQPELVDELHAKLAPFITLPPHLSSTP